MKVLSRSESAKPDLARRNRHEQSRVAPTRSSLSECVGDTPLVRLTRLPVRSDILLFAKLEMMNPGGSIKDRTAASLLRDGIRSGRIKSDSIIVESTSGNLGIGLAQACAQLDLELRLMVDERTNPQTIQLIRIYGGKIEKVEPSSPSESLLSARLRRVKEFLATHSNAVWVNQYSNPANPEAHHATMGEIIRQTRGELDRIYIATSTGGTLAGCRNYLRYRNLDVEVIAVDAEGSCIFHPLRDDSTRHIPGHGSSRTSDFFSDFPEESVRLVSDRDCVDGCRILVEKEGILAGGSSGGVITAVLRDAPSLESGTRAAVILCDRGERYLDTIYNDEWVTQTLGDTA